MRARSFRTALLALAPFAFLLALLGVYPAVQVVRMSFSDVEVRYGSFQWGFAGLENFRALASDPLVGGSAQATLLFTLGALPLSLIAGTVLALAVDRARWLGGLARTALLWPVVMTPVVISVLWLLMLSPTIGAVNRALDTFGLPEQGWLGSRTGALVSVVAVDVWHWTPLVFLVVYTALRNVDGSVVEAARLDGAGESRLTWHVLLPMVAPAIAAAAVIRLVMCVKAFDEMYLLTRGGPDGATTLVSLYIRTLVFDERALGSGAAFSLVVVLALALALVLVRLLRRATTLIRREAA
jgi:multiple sugar transport system permease protein